MPSVKEYNVKLQSLHNTEKITKTMKLVSMSKLYRAHEAQKRAKLYATDLTELLGRIAGAVELSAHPLLTPRENVNNVLVLLITSDRGLCGSFNNTLIKGVELWRQSEGAKYKFVAMSFCGKRGYAHFRKTVQVEKFYENSTARPDFAVAKAIGRDLMEFFLSKKYDEIHVCYNVFNSPLSQKPAFLQILPIEPHLLRPGEQEWNADYLFEPRRSQLLDVLIPKYLFFRIYFALLENSAGEHGARMTAMDSASQNASDLIDWFTLLRNRARQANITKELIEIVSGKEALQ
ncbi:MAG: ATP synthase F1 subunit gamma [Candidatus Omnitrophota bacterium]|nr:ATP synthase F1 subunit gamma [Candidatus Omnitrophota bacterium]MDZ4243338.1 ATP synthase F1 subunit gamma [Candidatus Omnitrophota bacterium]